ncbi:hypothetical protein ACFV23_19260 [Streptomyces sp. NPDC059627]
MGTSPSERTDVPDDLNRRDGLSVRLACALLPIAATGEWRPLRFVHRFGLAILAGVPVGLALAVVPPLVLPHYDVDGLIGAIVLTVVCSAMSAVLLTGVVRLRARRGRAAPGPTA